MSAPDRRRLVDRDLGGAEDQFAHSQVNRREFGSCIADPKGQNRTSNVEALGPQNLRLPIEWERGRPSLRSAGRL
jgi:hypothetical protein